MRILTSEARDMPLDEQYQAPLDSSFDLEVVGFPVVKVPSVH